MEEISDQRYNGMRRPSACVQSARPPCFERHHRVSWRVGRRVQAWDAISSAAVAPPWRSVVSVLPTLAVAPPLLPAAGGPLLPACVVAMRDVPGTSRRSDVQRLSACVCVCLDVGVAAAEAAAQMA